MVVFNRPINILCRVSLFLSMALCLLLRLFVFRLLRLKRFRSEERFSRNAETDLVCRLLLEKKTFLASAPHNLTIPVRCKPLAALFTHVPRPSSLEFRKT